MKALSFGEILWDVYPDERYIGGAPLNFAAHMARHGADVYMLSAVGNDPLGEETRAVVRTLGIREDYISTVAEKPTGRCLVTLAENGTPSYELLQDVAYDHIYCEKMAESFDLFYFGTLALRSGTNIATVKKLLTEKSFGEVFVDINIRPPFYSKDTVRFCLENATVLKISAEELPVVLDSLGMERSGSIPDTAAAIARAYRNLKMILLTCGGDGALAYDCVAGKTCFCPAQKVSVASTVGAGDSFSAAFAYRHFSGGDMESSLAYASKLAGFVVSKPEAVPEYTV